MKFENFAILETCGFPPLRAPNFQDSAQRPIIRLSIQRFEQVDASCFHNQQSISIVYGGKNRFTFFKSYLSLLESLLRSEFLITTGKQLKKAATSELRLLIQNQTRKIVRENGHSSNDDLLLDSWR